MSLILEAMELARCLRNPKDLAGVEPHDFAHDEIRRVVEGLKKSPVDTTFLKAFLSDHGCEFESGRASDAIREAVKSNALNVRMTQFRERALFQLALARNADHASMKRLLDRLQREHAEIEDGEAGGC